MMMIMDDYYYLMNNKINYVFVPHKQLLNCDYER